MRAGLAGALLILAGGLVAQCMAAVNCPRCGGCCDDRVCCPTVETKKVKVKCWECTCEEFCIPGMSKWDCCRWIPGCGAVRVRKELSRADVTKEVPDYKWEVKHVCDGCGSDGSTPTPAEPKPGKQPKVKPEPPMNGEAVAAAFVSDEGEPAAIAPAAPRAAWRLPQLPAPRTSPKPSVWRSAAPRPLSEMFFQRNSTTAIVSDSE